MVPQYGIGVTRNRFELFDNNEDPLEILKQQEIEKAERKKRMNGKENSSASKDSKKKPIASKIIKKDIQPREQKLPRFGQKPMRSNDLHGEIGKKACEDSRDSLHGSKSDNSVLKDKNGRSAKTANRGGKFSTPIDSRSKRDFEHHSISDKTGLKTTDKKDESGTFNRNNKAVTSETDNNLNYPEKTEFTVDADQTVTEQADDTSAAGSVENEAREMTLDEWKALKIPKPKPVYNLRKAGEGEDLSRWKKMYVLQKKKIEEYQDDEEYDHSDYPQRVGRLKHLLDVEIRFKDVRSNRGGPRRGTGRGRRNPSPRNLNETPAIKKELPKVDNEHEFPSLG